MGLLSLLLRLNPNENCIRILVLGLENSGKTSLVRSFVDLSNDPIQDVNQLTTTPTDGCEISKITFKNSRISFWDIGGSSSNKPYWHNYYDSADILMWVIDSTDVDKFVENKNELESILQSDHLIGTSLVVVATKQDCSNAAPFPDFIRDMEIDVKDRNWTVIAAANQGQTKDDLRDELEIGLEWIIQDFTSRKNVNSKCKLII